MAMAVPADRSAPLSVTYPRSISICLSVTIPSVMASSEGRQTPIAGPPLSKARARHGVGRPEAGALITSALAFVLGCRNTLRQELPHLLDPVH